MAKNRNSRRLIADEKYYTKLLISKSRRASLLVAFTAHVVGMTVLMFDMLIQHRPWLAMLVPVLLLGSAWILFPPTEEWQYRPWQAQAQKYEQHFKG